MSTERPPSAAPGGGPGPGSGPESGYRDDVPLYSSRITSLYLGLVRRRYPGLDVGDLLRAAGMERWQVEDPGHWFTQRQVNRFQARLRELTGNPGIAREAGLQNASPEVLGGIKRHILGLVSPGRAYALINHFVNKYTRSSRYESRRIGPRTVEVLVTPRPGVREESFQCENRFGHLEAVSGLFRLRAPRIDHPECLFRGHARCRYIVSWQPSPVERWRRARTLALPGLALAVGAVALLLPPWPALAVALPLAAVVWLGLSLRVSTLGGRELEAAVSALEGTSDELLEQHRQSYESALMINEIGQTLNRTSGIEEILAAIVEILHRRLDFDRGLVLLVDSARERLAVKARYGYGPELLPGLVAAGELDLGPARGAPPGVFASCLAGEEPLLVGDVTAPPAALPAGGRALLETLGATALICCPIVSEGEPLGILAVDTTRSRRPLLERDVNLLRGVAPQIAACIRNARLGESRFRQFQSILQVLVATTEARDPMTAGHAAKVTEYAVGICRQLGFPADYTEMIRVAASLHDYGKVGVHDAVLRKPGRLTSEELEQVRTHAARTREMLARVNFEGVYAEVPDVAGSHHERIDGSGYPLGLAGEAIPLGARILAVADVFEALTSKRHYREPMLLEEAFDELVANIDRHFDRRCVEALIAHYRETVAPVAYSVDDARRRLAAASPRPGEGRTLH